MRPLRPLAVAALVAAPLAATSLVAQGARAGALDQEIDRRTQAVNARVVAWRRDLHQHPELSNRETRTAGVVAAHLRALGLEVRTGVAKTGVVGVLRGGRPGPTVALRADMDALPVTELVDLPFKSTVRTTYDGQDVGVMHACGHDMHVAMLMGTAEVLAGMRQQLPGTVVFIFQPAEEGAPMGERGGARLMIEEGALRSPRPDAIFGLHVGVDPKPVGHIAWRALGTMASADRFRVVVRGRQTHGAKPWDGIDPIVASSQIVGALQTIVSRQTDLTTGPAIVTVGSMHGGVRNNIIPDSVVMLGTIRTFDEAQRRDIHARVRRTVEGIAQGMGATAEVAIEEQTLVTSNDQALSDRMAATLRRAAGAAGTSQAKLTTGAEDFSYFQREVPGLFFFLGVAPAGADLAQVAPNHSPHFRADEGALPVGVRAMAMVAADFLAGAAAAPAAAPRAGAR